MTDYSKVIAMKRESREWCREVLNQPAPPRKASPARKPKLDAKGYPPEWTHELREEVRAVYAWRCGYCNKHQRELPERLSVHHKNRNKTDCRIKNLVPLCFDCHVLVAHNGYYSNLAGDELNAVQGRQEDRCREERDRRWEEKKLDKERKLEYRLREAGLVPGV